MKRKTITLLSCIVASVALIGTTFAAFAVTDMADPMGFVVTPGEFEEDTETKYTTLEWGNSTSLVDKLDNIEPGNIYKLGIVSLKSNYVYNGVLSATLEDVTTVDKTGQKKLIDYVSLYLYEGANTDVEEGSLPDKTPLASTALGGTNMSYNNATGTSAGKEYSFYLSFDESATIYLSQMENDLLNLTIDWNPQTGDVNDEDHTIYFASNWDNCYLYAWNDKGYNAGWPGVAINKVGNNSLGQFVYKGVLLSGYTKFIFSNGFDGDDNKTPDLQVTSFDFTHGDLLFWKEDNNVNKAGSKVFEDSDLMPTSFDKGANPGPILHAWGWSNSDVQTRLSSIANAGYKAVQLSPMQPLGGGSSTNKKWYDVYQPLGFKVADSGENPFGDKTSLTSLTNAANNYGIDIIVDVVCNHLAGTGDSLYEGVKYYEDTIYNNQTTYLHKSGGLAQGEDTYWITKGNLSNMPDLKTEETFVQNRVINMLEQYINCGVKGFRFDAAKHIETEKDGSYKSSFWKNVIGTINAYGLNKYGKTPYSYGEVLGIGGNRDWTGYTDYIDVTDNGVSWNVRAALQATGGDEGAMASSCGYTIYGGGDNALLFGETHDNFIHDGTNYIPDARMNLLYGLHASRADASALYFARPCLNEDHGNDTGIRIWTPRGPSEGQYDYCGPVVSAANKLHNDFVGGNEYIYAWEGCVINIRQIGNKYGIYICDASDTITASRTINFQLFNGNGNLPTSSSYRNLMTNSYETVYSYDNKTFVTATLINNVAVLEFNI